MADGPIVGIVLAAGSSSRLGRPKQLLPFAGRPLLEQTLRLVNAAGLAEVVVVLGGSAVAIQQQVNFGRARPLVNPDYQAGQSTSLRVGLAAVAATARAVVFILGDQPLQQTATIDALIATYRQTGGAIVMPSYRGVRGNPVLFDRRLFPQLEALTGDEGARSLLRAQADHVVTVPIDSPPPADVDSWADYRAVLRAAGQPDPGPPEA